MRPLLAALAADPDTTNVRKLWKALTPEERAAGITSSFADDSDGWVKRSTRAAVASILRFRPQTVATWPKDKLVSEAARLQVEEPSLISSFLVDLHLGHRRPMMGAFLDALGIANDNGRIDSENVEVPVQDPAKLAAAADGLLANHAEDEVVTYFLTLLLQDSSVWGGLKDWLKARPV